MMHPTRLLLALSTLSVIVIAGGCRKAAPPPEEKPAAATAPKAPPVAQTVEADRGNWHTIRRGDLTETLPAVGTFYPKQTSQIGAQVMGRVASVLVSEGDVVRPGQLLAQIDDSLLRIEVSQRQADVMAARARIESAHEAIASAQKGVVSANRGVASARDGVANAEASREQFKTAQAEAALNLERMKNLWEKPQGQFPSIPRSRYDDAMFAHQKAQAAVAVADARVKETQSRVDEAQSRVDEAQSRVAEAQAREREAATALKQAQAAVALAQEKLSLTRITAPYGGMITKRYMDPGDNAATGPGNPLVELQDIRHLDLEFPLPQGYLGQIHQGTPLTYQVENLPGSNGRARINLIIPTADEATRSFKCRASVANNNMRLKPGLLAQVEIRLKERRAVLWAPQTALVAHQAGWRVMLKTGDETTPRDVRTGMTAGQRVEIVSGLNEGDVVFIPEAGQ